MKIHPAFGLQEMENGSKEEKVEPHIDSQPYSLLTYILQHLSL